MLHAALAGAVLIAHRASRPPLERIVEMEIHFENRETGKGELETNPNALEERSSRIAQRLPTRNLENRETENGERETNPNALEVRSPEIAQHLPVRNFENREIVERGTGNGAFLAQKSFKSLRLFDSAALHEKICDGTDGTTILPTATAETAVLPKALNTIVPVYPRSARRKGHEGSVTVEVAVSPEGTIEDVAVVSSSTFPELDRSAIDAARSIRFAPAEEGGKRVSGRLRMTFDFRFGEAQPR